MFSQFRTFSFLALFSVICHLIKNDSSASSSASFAFSCTAVVFELSVLLLQLDLFETLDLLLLLTVTEGPLDEWLLLDCKQIQSSSAFFSQMWALILKLKICLSIISICSLLSTFSPTTSYIVWISSCNGIISFNWSISSTSIFTRLITFY